MFNLPKKPIKHIFLWVYLSHDVVESSSWAYYKCTYDETNLLWVYFCCGRSQFAQPQLIPAHIKGGGKYAVWSLMTSRKLANDTSNYGPMTHDDSLKCRNMHSVSTMSPCEARSFLQCPTAAAANMAQLPPRSCVFCVWPACNLYRPCWISLQANMAHHWCEK